MQFTIPDLISACPLTDATNPHFDEVVPTFQAWIHSWNISTEEKRKTLNRIRAELLASHTYPDASAEQFRTCCDVLHLLWVIDEISDEQNEKDAKDTAHMFYKALSDPNWEDDTVFGLLTVDVRDRFLPLAGPGFLRRFLKHFDLYVNAVSKEAKLRGDGETVDLAAFTTFRRECSGTLISQDLCELALGIDLPDEVFEHPVVQRLFEATSDLICWSNDIYSYNLEQASGIAGANIITVLQKDMNLDLQGAMDYAGEYWKTLMRQWLDDRDQLPSWGPATDAAVAKYVEGLGHWVVGNLFWSFETERYFGKNHREIQQTRRVTLRKTSPLTAEA